MKIESKEKARDRGVPSPDRAEALMLALCKPPPVYDYTPVPQERPNRGDWEEKPAYMYPDHSGDRDSPSYRPPRRGSQWLYKL